MPAPKSPEFLSKARVAWRVFRSLVGAMNARVDNKKVQELTARYGPPGKRVLGLELSDLSLMFPFVLDHGRPRILMDATPSTWASMAAVTRSQTARRCGSSSSNMSRGQ